MKLTELKGIGPKTAALFEKLGLFNAEDLLSYYPLHYDFYEPPRPVGAVTAGEKCAVKGIIAHPVSVRPGGKATFFTTVIEDATGKLRLNWFNAPYVQALLRRGSVYVFRGQVLRRGAELVMEHPEILTLARYEGMSGTLVPIYGLTKGLSNQAVIRAVRQALALLPAAEEYLPDACRPDGLLNESKAVMGIHFPEDTAGLLSAQKRLAFDELFFFILAMRRLRQMSEAEPNAFPLSPTWQTETAIEELPFRLTNAQLRVWREIEGDLTGPHPMERLVQGDVGSGKTVLAFLAMLLCAENGFQSVLLAPTEVLARQHFEKLKALSESSPAFAAIRPVLLTGSLRAVEKRNVRKAIAGGEANAILGTHAVLESSVEYPALALVITDEQHRFGVRQRAALTKRGSLPHILSMSATPIPRTLGVIYYSGLCLSTVDELPASRLRIRTAVVDETWREKTDSFLQKELAAGHQAYVVCPMIEPSEELSAMDVGACAKRLRKVLPDATVGVLHGRMSPEEKEKAMTAFAEGKTRVLVSTTVIEVGVDVPNATVILVENAERFGLATLHQLRGRVGRGAAQSYCIFMRGSESEAAGERLEILKKTVDGFRIAEEDFRLRGAGDLLGIRQSGDARFSAADLTRDGDMVLLAGQLAADILKEDPELAEEGHARIREKLTAYFEEEERTGIL